MRNIMLSFFLIGAVSCSVKPQVTEAPAARAVSSDDYAKMMNFYKDGRVAFNKKAEEIKKSAQAKINKFNKDPLVKACESEYRATRAFTNSCTKALALCQKSKVRPFDELYTSFIEIAYKDTIIVKLFMKGKMKEEPSNKFYQNGYDIAFRIQDDMRPRAEAVLEDIYKERSFYGLGEAFGGANQTSDNQDNVKSCSASLNSALDSYDSWHRDLDELIPR